MTNERSWEEFRQSGLFWFVNTILHVFGWAIAITVDENGHAVDGYPMHCDFRGFSGDCNDQGYKRINSHLKENIERITDIQI